MTVLASSPDTRPAEFREDAARTRALLGQLAGRAVEAARGVAQILVAEATPWSAGRCWRR